MASFRLNSCSRTQKKMCLLSGRTGTCYKLLKTIDIKGCADMKLPQTTKTDNILLTGLVMTYAGIAIQFGNGYGMIVVGVALAVLAITAKFNGAD